MKKGLLLGAVTAGFLFSQNSVYALTGNANVELNGNLVQFLTLIQNGIVDYFFSSDFENISRK